MGEAKVRLLNRNGVRTSVFLFFAGCAVLGIVCVLFELTDLARPVGVLYLISMIPAVCATRCPHCGRFRVPLMPFQKSPARCGSCGMALDQERVADAFLYRRIRDLRIAAQLTPEEVAKQLGMSKAGYVRYEHGESEPPAQMITKLARFYHTTTDYILGLSDEK